MRYNDSEFSAEEIKHFARGYPAVEAWEKYSSREWDRLFRRLCHLVTMDIPAPDGSPKNISDWAIRWLARAATQEAVLREAKRQPTQRSVERRLGPILTAVGERERIRAGAIALFGSQVSRFKHSLRHRTYLLESIAAQRNAGVAESGLLAMELSLQDWSATWETDSARFIALLDHEDDWVRAQAADVLGQLCCRWTPATVPRADAFRLILEKETERAGVAVAFWSGLGGEYGMRDHDDDVTLPPWPRDRVDPSQWIMDLLIAQNGPEVRVANEPRLAWVASMRFAGDWPRIAECLRRGFVDVAVSAACQTRICVPEIEQFLLMMSSVSVDPDTIAEASRTLATVFGVLSPRAQELGFVKQFDLATGARVFLEIAGPGMNAQIAAIHPPTFDDEWSEIEVWANVDALVPGEIRGTLESDWNPNLGVREHGWHFSANVFVKVRKGRASNLWSSIEIIAGEVSTTWDMEASLRKHLGEHVSHPVHS